MTLPNHTRRPERPPNPETDSIGGAQGRAVGDDVPNQPIDPFAYLTIGLACLTLALAIGTTASWALSFRLSEPILLTNYGIVVLGFIVLRYSGRRS